jgi:hypothetical protein
MQNSGDIKGWDVSYLNDTHLIDCSIYGVDEDGKSYYLDNPETYTSKYISSELTGSDINNILTNYTQTLDTEGHVIQYKYCINDLFDPKYSDIVQVPTFAAYPIYEIVQPIHIIAGYDYENPANLIYVDCSNIVVYSSDTDHQIYDKIGSAIKNIKWDGLASDDFLTANNR